MTESLADARQLVIDAGAVLAHVGHGDLTRGHVSMRVPGQPELFLMKPHSVGLDEITPDSVLTLGLDGKVVAGSARRHSEVYIHSEIYRARPDVGAVTHTHPMHLVAFSSLGRPLRPISHGGAMFAGRLAVFEATIGLIRSAEGGCALAETMGPHQAVLMRAHGMAMTGRTLQEAVIAGIMLEEAAQIQLMAEAAGPLVDDFPSDDVEHLRRDLMAPEQFAINFAYLARRARRA